MSHQDTGGMRKWRWPFEYRTLGGSQQGGTVTQKPIAQLRWVADINNVLPNEADYYYGNAFLHLGLTAKGPRRGSQPWGYWCKGSGGLLGFGRSQSGSAGGLGVEVMPFCLEKMGR